MTSTVPRAEGGLRESETVQDGWIENLMEDWYGFRTEPRILVSHQRVDTNLSVPFASPVYAGQILPAALNYVVTWIQPFAEGSTGLVNDSPQAEMAIRDQLDRVIALTAGEVFLDGMESRLSFWLKHMLGVGGNTTIRVIRSILNSEGLNAEEVGEILRVLGDFEDSMTHRSRLSLLLEYLKSPDSRTRDAASIGIASLDDPSALYEVEKAALCEDLPELKEDLQLVVDQLRARQCRLS